MNAPPIRLPGSRAAASRGHAAIAWTGAALFAVSLAYFLFSYAVTFGEIAAGPRRAAPVAIDIALFTAFALHHSVFARQGVRARIAQAVTPALERSIYVWVASLMLIGVCALWQPVAGLVWQVRGVLAWLLPLVQVAGLWLTLRSAAIIDIWELAGVRQVSRGPGGPEDPPRQAEGRDEQGPGSPPPGGGPSDPRAPTPFKTEGPYGWLRHPIYLGWLLLVFPVATMTITRFVFAVVSTVYLVIAIPLEERTLRRSAGGAYETYMRKVRWKLIPGLY